MLNENRFLDTFRGDSKRTNYAEMLNNTCCEITL